MVQSLDRFTIDVRNQIGRSETCFKRRATLFHGHHQMVHRIEISVTKVYTNRVYSETETARTPPNDDRWLKVGDQR